MLEPRKNLGTLSLDNERERKRRKILAPIVGVLQIGIRAWLQHLAFLGS